MRGTDDDDADGGDDCDGDDFGGEISVLSC